MVRQADWRMVSGEEEKNVADNSRIKAWARATNIVRTSRNELVLGPVDVLLDNVTSVDGERQDGCSHESDETSGNHCSIEC